MEVDVNIKETSLNDSGSFHLCHFVKFCRAIHEVIFNCFQVQKEKGKLTFFSVFTFCVNLELVHLTLLFCGRRQRNKQTYLTQV